MKDIDEGQRLRNNVVWLGGLYLKQLKRSEMEDKVGTYPFVLR